ncbi:hypothetical protein [Vibrio hippocampi]|uniref:Uncharacterized protein n=1 Tax=Vibrio hippocampi TaxID=654686 RepID=A0ABM8ZFP0_9VIBR|nr:hypothetical protein [Vibrio hippocampi]CAH0524894.1 hypothetical protein VHP8226_00569 [Vibrio hippocampi]
MPSFEPSFYQNQLNHFDEQRENVSYAKAHYVDHWSTLRLQWQDNASRNIALRIIEPLCDNYSELTQTCQQQTHIGQQTADKLSELSQLLLKAAGIEDEYEQAMRALEKQSQSRQTELQVSDERSEQLRQRNQEVEAQLERANSHIEPM